MERELALRQLLATTSFTFVEDKVLLRNASVLKAVSELQRHASYAPGLPGELAAVPAYKQSSSSSR